MENLNRVIAAYTAMDQRRKGEALFYLEEIAREFPIDEEENPLVSPTVTIRDRKLRH
ncbi:hypothetical protein [Duganella sp. BJB475]|uniref:hypothetical protein n=1 Tax=Duganella sp. BJB475 TaxID=2233914 RepID=UPI0018F4452E|nr:hypothetical protein [Duganella sp. BJB475]